MATKRKPPTRVAGYARISVALEESVSIESQTALINAESQRRSWPSPDLFIDEGISGSKSIKRPARDDLERRIRAGEFGAVLVKSVDRLARSVLDFHRLATAARDAGCELVVIDTGLDTGTPIGRMVLGMLAQFAEFEAEQISARVTLSNVTRRKAGRALGGPVPYGLVNVPAEDRSGMVRRADADKAAVVRRIADELLAGGTLRGIARGLNADGIPTPRVSANGSVWDRAAVRRVITNPAVAGMERALGDIVRGDDGLRRVIQDAAILTPGEYREVLAVVEGRRDDRRRTPYAERLLLADLARCASCEGRMTRSTTRGFTSYACSLGTLHRCSEPASVSAPALDEHVVAEFLAALGDTERTTTERTEDGNLSARVLTVRAEIAECAAAFAEATSDQLAGLADRMTALRNTEAALLLEADSAPVFATVGTGRTWREDWDAAEGDTAARSALLGEAVARVRVRRAGRGRRVPLAERVAVDWE